MKRLVAVASWLFERAAYNAKALLSPTVLGVMGIVVDADGRVLLVKHSYVPGWHFPGGSVDRGEPPDIAVARELKEEIGLSGGTVTMTGVYTCRAGWATNVILLYRITGATLTFKPNLEIREIIWVDPAIPPEDINLGCRRRLAELQGQPVSQYW